MSRYLCKLLCIFLINSQLCTCDDDHEMPESGEARIYETIQKRLEELGETERPVENASEPVHIYMKDEKNQVMETNVWLNFVSIFLDHSNTGESMVNFFEEWNDTRLIWNAEDYDNVSDVRFPPDKVWRPDILLYNSVDSSFGRTYMSNILVFSHGAIQWIPPGITKSSCKLDVTWFPFDDQICRLKFGSWTYYKDKIVLHTAGINASNYFKNMESGEWILLDYPSRVVDVEKGDKIKQYIIFEFHLRRRKLYFGFNLITPSLIVAIMSILGFTLPVESGEKITLEITILLSITLFLFTVLDVTPVTSESLPLLSLFFFCHMVSVTVSIAFSVVVLNYHYRTPKTHSMSDWTRKILLNWLPWLLMMKRPEHELESPPFLTRDVSIPDSLRSDHSESECHFRLDEYSAMNDTFARRNQSRRMVNPNTAQACLQLEARIEKSLRSYVASDTDEYGTQAILVLLQQIYYELKFMTEFAQREEEIDNVIDDWHFAATVVDRLCLVFFSAFIVCASMGVLLQSPNFFE